MNDRDISVHARDRDREAGLKTRNHVHTDVMRASSIARIDRESNETVGHTRGVNQIVHYPEWAYARGVVHRRSR
jgi:hypothetical protein